MLIRLFFLFFLASPLFADSSFDSSVIEELPVLYRGRYRPMGAYAKLWLYEISGQEAIAPSEAALYQASSAVELIWKLQALGGEPWNDTPLFLVDSKEIKELLGLSTQQKRFSYRILTEALSKVPLSDHLQPLIRQLDSFRAFTQHPPSLDKRLSLKERLLSYGDQLCCLPCKTSKNEWVNLEALQAQIPSDGKTTLIANFTPYSDEEFYAIRNNYEALKATSPQKIGDQATLLTESLYFAYKQHLAGTLSQKASGKNLFYPSLLQLKIENWLYRYPFLKWIIASYLLAATAFYVAHWKKNSSLYCIAYSLLLIGFFIHTATIAGRCFVLGRPPVSNMLESVIYAPWVAVLGSIILRFFFKTPWLFIASSLSAALLLFLLQLAIPLNQLDPLQAVLDSQYWLIIHVLMVVGSYGAYLLASLLGHIYLVVSHRKKIPSQSLHQLSRAILQSLYAGTALLILGTILGGIWAAESWGRFWDWDPKESWAFISSCIYLIWIHLYRFGLIKQGGLAMGAVTGFLAISFTWYGVNYILGTGLHSYGFGTGGEVYFYLFLLAEILFISYFFFKRLSLKDESAP